MTAPDPQNVPRNPLSRHTSRLCVCRLRETPSGDLVARMTPRYLVTLGFSLLLGMGSLVALLALLRRGEKTGAAVAGGFAAFYLGFALLAFRGTRSRMTFFDRKAGVFRRRGGETICRLDRIAAIQLLPPGEWRNAEINLVLSDGTRHHVLAFPNEETMKPEAEKLSRWLGGTPIWPNGGL